MYKKLRKEIETTVEKICDASIPLALFDTNLERALTEDNAASYVNGVLKRIEGFTKTNAKAVPGRLYDYSRLGQDRTEIILGKYRECEDLLRDFFNELNYCYPNCISRKLSKYSPRYSGHIGCCPEPCYADYGILGRKIKELYGEPAEKEGACGYHSSDGCMIKTYKSPTCISFLCRRGVEHVEKNYGFIYEWENVRDVMTSLTGGLLHDRSLAQLQSSLQSYNKIVRDINQLFAYGGKE